MTPETWVESNFPGVSNEGYNVTSPIDRDYNCIAYAAGDMEHWWEPSSGTFAGGYYWPSGAPREYTIAAYVAAYETLGYSVCDSGDHEHGVEKVAVYAKGSQPTHAARQDPTTGRWHSKLGQGYDIEHNSMDGVAGINYGSPAAFLSRPASTM